MRSLKLALLATAAVAALSSAAAAADLIVDVPISDPVIDNSFSFDGAYIGLFVLGQTAPGAYGIGANLGVNVLMDSLLVGAEIEGAVTVGPNYQGQITGRVGGLISDSAIIYAYSGIGTNSATDLYVPVGIGAEVAVADNVGIKGELQYNFDLAGGDPDSVTAKIGLNFHF